MRMNFFPSKHRLAQFIFGAYMIIAEGILSSAFVAPASCRRTSYGSRHRCSSSKIPSNEDGVGPRVSMEKVLFVEVGFGNDQHGQDPTKACVRACRNAIEFNSIPSINSIVPGGYANMKLRVQLAVPVPAEEVDMEQIKNVFPYGQLLPVEFQRGGMRAASGIELPEMGDRGDDMIIAISCVTVGY